MPKESLKLMHSSNSLVIPRNHKVEEALDFANNGDLKPTINFYLKIFKKPYEDKKEINEYQSPAPPSDKK